MNLLLLSNFMDVCFCMRHQAQARKQARRLIILLLANDALKAAARWASSPFIFLRFLFIFSSKGVFFSD